MPPSYSGTTTSLAPSDRCAASEAGSCARAEAAARHLINLPTHGRISARDAERVLATVGGDGTNTLSRVEAFAAGRSY